MNGGQARAQTASVAGKHHSRKHGIVMNGALAVVVRRLNLIFFH
jgi:hypothetical protein